MESLESPLVLIKIACNDPYPITIIKRLIWIMDVKLTLASFQQSRKEISPCKVLED